MSTKLTPVDLQLVKESLCRRADCINRYNSALIEATKERDFSKDGLESLSKDLGQISRDLDQESASLIEYFIRYLAQTGVYTWAEAETILRTCGYLK